jgi:hypothetical protein
MEKFDNEMAMEGPKRPTFLKVLCILTFIGSGLGIIFSLLTPLMKDWYVNMMQANPNVDEQQYEQAMKAFNAGWGYFLLSAALSVGTLIGAILMWNLKKNGFFIYVFCTVAMLVLPMLMTEIEFKWYSAIIPLGFVGMYAANLKALK